MAEPTKIPSLNPLVDNADKEALKDYLNLQSEVEQSIKRQNNSLFAQLGIRKDLSLNMREYFIKAVQLSKEIESSKNLEKQLTEGLATIVDETQRRSQLQIINSIKQRREAYESELDLLHKMKALGFLPIVWAISKVYSLFKDLDKSAWEFRRAMGMTRDSANQLRKTIQNIAIDYMHVGVTADSAAAAMMSLGKEMGSIRTVTKDLVKTTAILKSQLGVAEDDTAGFLKNMAAISKSTMQTQENMAYIVADLSMAAGVPLPLIMKDLATKSGTTLTMMSRLPNQVARAAVELRKMGTSLDQAAKSSREILNFSDNINAEMEASVLLGRSINLQHARELAYRRDLEGSTREILKLTNQIDFSNLDVFQQEAFARATGKSVDELMKLVQAEKQWKAARATPELAGQVAAYEQMRAANQAIAKASAANLKLMLEQRSNQERLTAISQKWNQIISKVASIFLPIVDMLLAAIVPLIDIGVELSVISTVFKVGVGFAKQMSEIVSIIGMKVYNIGGAFQKLGDLIQFGKFNKFFSLIGNIGEILDKRILLSLMNFGRYGAGGISFIDKLFVGVSKLGTMFSKVFGIVGLIFPRIATFFSIFGKAIPVIGWIITAFQFFKGMVDDWSSTAGENIFYRIFHAIWAGIKAVIVPIWDMLKWPFVKLWEWFTGGPLSGNSPSELGMSIVRGIVSVGAMIFDALTSPWRNALAWITSKIPGMSGIADKLSGGVSGLLKKPLEARISTDTKSTITPVGMKVASEAATQTATVVSDSKEKSSASSDVLLGNILDAINTLNKNLENGKIGFYIDGQLMSATLARQTEFRNGYGVNKARA